MPVPEKCACEGWVNAKNRSPCLTIRGRRSEQDESRRLKFPLLRTRSAGHVLSPVAGNPQVGRSVTVCSRIQPPFNKRECDNEKDHFKLGTLPAKPDEYPGMRGRRSVQTTVAEGGRDVVRILPIDFLVGTSCTGIAIGSSNWLRNPSRGEARNLANIWKGNISFGVLVNWAQVTSLATGGLPLRQV